MYSTVQRNDLIATWTGTNQTFKICMNFFLVNIYENFAVKALYIYIYEYSIARKWNFNSEKSQVIEIIKVTKFKYHTLLLFKPGELN